MPPSFTAYAGAWSRHDTAGLTVSPSGQGSVGVPDFTACSSCSEATAPINTINFSLTSVQGNSALGSVTAVTDPNDPVTPTNMGASVGEPLELLQTPGSPGELLNVEIHGSSIGTFCDATAAADSECGA
jgi:hypothetical protein